LSASIDNERTQLGRHRRNRMVEQFGNTSFPRIVESLCAAEHHDQCMRLYKVERFQNGLHIYVARCGNNDGAISVLESNRVFPHDFLLPGLSFFVTPQLNVAR
jgi:hypothetical protein